MAKRKRITNEKVIEKLIKEGRGQGIGENYKPWILIQDVPSRGRATRLKGIKTNRQHEFLSDLERNNFYLLEYSDIVIDIREQFPLLPLEETTLIAKELGIKHPTDPITNEAIVMTTDFLVTVNRNGKDIDIARTIKLKDDLNNKRVLEKFEIERRYWEKHDVKDLAIEYIKRVIDGTVSIREISNKFDDDLFLQRGTGISLFKHLLMREVDCQH